MENLVEVQDLWSGSRPGKAKFTTYGIGGGRQNAKFKTFDMRLVRAIVALSVIKCVSHPRGSFVLAPIDIACRVQNPRHTGPGVSSVLFGVKLSNTSQPEAPFRHPSVASQWQQSTLTCGETYDTGGQGGRLYIVQALKKNYTDWKFMLKKIGPDRCVGW